MEKVVYITVKSPFGSQETFILTEILALKESGTDILIIPRDISNKIFHKKAKQLLGNTLSIPWFDFKIAMEFLKYICTNLISFFKIVNNIAFKAKNAKIAFKNLIILPKGLYLSSILKQQSISHIHAHWASTTATMAYIIYEVTGIPWSFTAHRWDIPENNLLKEKCKTASFVRVIDEKGRQEMIEIINDLSLIKNILVMHMGVVMSKPAISLLNLSKQFKFLCPANFLPKKGHRYLFEACRILSDRGVKYKCLIAGDGPLEDELRGMVRNLELDDCIEFLGRLPHERLFDLYGRGEIDAVVLPSIITQDAEKEGIPVALMEAMSYGIPVISTKTGGIPELIGGGSGIMIDEKESHAIADSIEKLMKDSNYYNFIGEKGKEKIERDFNVHKISKKLLALYSGVK